jgi:gliding motility-associated-like protein
VTDKNGCQGLATKVIEVLMLPYGNLIGKTEVCVPFCEKYSIITAKTSSLIDWNIIYDNKDITAEKLCISSPGEHTVIARLNDKETGCKNEVAFYITALEKPNADFKWTPENPVEGIEDVQLTNMSTGNNQKTWTWFVTGNAAHSRNENTSFFFRENGNYPVALVVENKFGCKDTAVKYIKIESDFSLYIPNAFTPNGDGLNDIFKPVVRGVKKFRLEIFNRWGERMYITLNPLEGWDGLHKEEECKVDSYAWKISLTTNSGEEKSITGNTLLSR